MQGWAFDSLAAPLPTGLPHGASISVVEASLASDGVTPMVVVEDEQARRWHLCLSQLHDARFPSSTGGPGSLVCIEARGDRRSVSVA